MTIFRSYSFMLLLAVSLFHSGRLCAQPDIEEVDAIIRERAPMAISSKQRFMVRGLEAADRALLGQWAEDVADQIEHLIGYPLPFGANQRVVISCSDSPPDQPARILPQQRMTEYFLMQKLYIFGFDHAEKETMLEGLTWLLLNRYAIAKQPRETRKILLSQVPPWFSIGCSQKLFEGVYARDRKAIIGEWSEEEIPRLADVLAYGDLGLARRSERAACGLAFDWLVSRPDFQEIVPPLFTRWGSGDTIDARWLIDQFPEISNPLELDKHWNLWLAHAGKGSRAWAMSPAEQIHRLRSLMVIRPGVLKIPYPADAPETLTWEDLLDVAEASWFIPLVAKLKWEVLFVSMGPQPGIGEVAQRYTDYLDQFLHGKDRKRYVSGNGRKKMLKMLEEAHTALNGYERLYLLRRSYVDQFDRRLSKTNHQ